MHHHIGLGQQARRLDRQQIRIARAGPDQMHYANAPSLAAERDQTAALAGRGPCENRAFGGETVAGHGFRSSKAVLYTRRRGSPRQGRPRKLNNWKRDS